MRTLLLYSHPVESSYGASLCEQTRLGLEQAGHQVDCCDLYAEGFTPVLSRHERLIYHDVPINRENVESYVQRLKNAEALVLVTPIWHFGFPAMLKGFFDRVFLPGVSFELQDERMRYILTHIKKLAAVTTYGADRSKAFLVGDPPRKVVTRVIRAQIHPMAKTVYLAHYGMNRSTDATRLKFLSKVRTQMEKF